MAASCFLKASANTMGQWTDSVRNIQKGCGSGQSEKYDKCVRENQRMSMSNLGLEFL